MLPRRRGGTSNRFSGMFDTKLCDQKTSMQKDATTTAKQATTPGGRSRRRREGVSRIASGPLASRSSVKPPPMTLERSPIGCHGRAGPPLREAGETEARTDRCRQGH